MTKFIEAKLDLRSILSEKYGPTNNVDVPLSNSSAALVDYVKSLDGPSEI